MQAADGVVYIAYPKGLNKRDVTGGIFFVEKKNLDFHMPWGPFQAEFMAFLDSNVNNRHYGLKI